MVGVAGGSAKLITGDESQKTTIRTPGRDGGAGAFVAKTEKLTREHTSDGNQRAGNPQCPPMKAKSQSPPAPGLYAPIAVPACETELEHLRRTLAAYMGAEPPKGFERSILLRARGASVAQIEELLDRKWAEKKFRSGGRHGPRTWNWFLQVVGNEFSPVERGRWPEAAAAPQPEHEASSDALARGIEALEQNDPADSLVCSHQCKCGAEIRQYTSRVVGTCTCQDQARAGAA